MVTIDRRTFKIVNFSGLQIKELHILYGIVRRIKEGAFSWFHSLEKLYFSNSHKEMIFEDHAIESLPLLN